MDVLAISRGDGQSHAQTPVTSIPMIPPATARSTNIETLLQQPRAPQDCSVAKHPPFAVTGAWHPAAHEPAMTPAAPKPQQHSAAKTSGTRSGPNAIPTSVLIVMGLTPHAMPRSGEQKGDGSVWVAFNTTASSRSCGITATRELDASAKDANTKDGTRMRTALQRCCLPPDPVGPYYYYP